MMLGVEILLPCLAGIVAAPALAEDAGG